MAAPTLNRVVADFTCEATGDKSIQLKKLRGQKVVIYFYPKDSTPGCTTEGQDFRDLHGRFRRQKTVILGVSRDSIASHEKFKAKQKMTTFCPRRVLRLPIFPRAATPLPIPARKCLRCK